MIRICFSLRRRRPAKTLPCSTRTSRPWRASMCRRRHRGCLPRPTTAPPRRRPSQCRAGTSRKPFTPCTTNSVRSLSFYYWIEVVIGLLVDFKPLVDNLPQMDDDMVIPPPPMPTAQPVDAPPAAPTNTTILNSERRLSAIPVLLLSSIDHVQLTIVF